MTEYTALRITRTAQAAFAAGPDAYWLRIVQDEENDLVTTGEVAELVDSLYDIDPCITTAETETGTEEEEQDPPEEEDLYRAAKDVFGADLVACRAALSGDYTAEIKIYRSHPEEAYKLVLSAGEVVQTVVAAERITESIDVQSASSVDLEYPISGGVSAGWLGPVIGQGGLIAAPEIKRSGNTLYWDGPATGTIRVDLYTSVDIVTVEVPGLPIFPASDVGTAQDVKVLAFYHMMVFPGEIHKPIEDDSITAGELKQLCGYNNSGELGDADDSDEPLPAPPEPPDYGCQAWEPALAEPATFEAFCCHSNPHPYACVLKTAPNRGGGTLSQEEIDRFLAINPRTSFQPVTPPGAEGCGTIYYQIAINKHNCCDEAGPITIPINLVVGDNSTIVLAVAGGLATGPWYWSVRKAGVFFDVGHSKRDVVTVGPSVRLYTTDVCGSIPVTVSDGCSTETIYIRAENGQWVSQSYWHWYNNPGGTVASCPGGEMTVLANSEYAQTVQFLNSNYKYVEGLDKLWLYHSGGSAYTPELIAYHCGLTWDAFGATGVSACAPMMPPIRGCDPPFCADCGYPLTYRSGAVNSGGRGPQLISNQLWLWEC